MIPHFLHSSFNTIPAVNQSVQVQVYNTYIFGRERHPKMEVHHQNEPGLFPHPYTLLVHNIILMLRT